MLSVGCLDPRPREWREGVGVGKRPWTEGGSKDDLVERSGRWRSVALGVGRGGQGELYDDEVIGAERGYKLDSATMRELLNDGWGRLGRG